MIQQAALVRGRHVAVTAVVAGLELTWLYTLLFIANDALGVSAPVWSLLLLYVASVGWTVLLRRLCRSPRVVVVLSWSLWLVVPLLSLTVFSLSTGATVFMIVTSAALWWLAARTAGTRFTHRSVLARVLVGLVVLSCSLLVGYVTQTDETVAAPAVLLFTGFALGASAMTRVEDGGSQGTSRRGGAWWAMLTAGLVAVLGVGLAIAALVTPDLLGLVWRGVRDLGGLIADLFRALGRLLPSSCTDSSDVSGGTMPTDVHDLPVSGGGVEPAAPSGSSLTAGMVYMGIIIGSLVLLVGWLFVSHLLQWMRKTGEDKAEMEYLPGGFRLDLRRLFHGLMAWLRRLKSLGGHDLDRMGESAQTAFVRRLYADMLRWGARAGLPRASWQTPYEYQVALSAALPAYGADVAFITEGYVQTRYAAQPPTESELQRLRETWRTLKRRKPHPVERGPAGPEAEKVAEDHDIEHS